MSKAQNKNYASQLKLLSKADLKTVALVCLASCLMSSCLPPPSQEKVAKQKAAIGENADQESNSKPQPIPPTVIPTTPIAQGAEEQPQSPVVVDNMLPTTPVTPTPESPPLPEPNPMDPAPVACALPYAAGAKIVKIKVGAFDREFRLFVPKQYDGKTLLPVVMNFHGSSNDVNDFAKSSGMEATAEREGFIVAGIAGVNKEWNVPPVAGKTDEVLNAKMTIEYLSKNLCVNKKRIYATGFSGGGRTSSLLGCKMPELLAAIAPVAGVRWPGSCVNLPLPVFAIHGLKDTTNSYKGDGNPRWNESVESAVQSWADNNSCEKTRVEDAVNGTLQVYHYKSCKNGSTVKLLRMHDQGHTYPTGKPINTANELWWFLKNFERK